MSSSSSPATVSPRERGRVGPRACFEPADSRSKRSRLGPEDEGAASFSGMTAFVTRWSDAPRPAPSYRVLMHEPVQPPLTRRLGPGQWILLDTVVATLFAMLVFGVVRSGRSAQGFPTVGSLALVLALTTPLAVRRLRPLAVFVVVLGAGAFGSVTHLVPEVFVAAATAVALHMVGLRMSGRRSALALAVAVAVISGTSTYRYLSTITDHGGRVVLDIALMTAVAYSLAILPVIMGVGWLIGAGLRQQRGHAETQRQQAMRQAVVDERVRIARELHDVVSHSMSVIAIKSGIADYLADADPAHARRALVDIHATSQDALRELRHLLGVLRLDDASTTDDQAALQPAPGLAQLDELVARTAATGVRVELRVLGDSRPLPSGIDLSAYRIIQEALTNVVRHAPSARCVVTVEHRPGEVMIDITSDGPARDTRSSRGHGLVGMRERIGLYSGHFSAGPLPGGGFRVLATIPTGNGDQ